MIVSKNAKNVYLDLSKTLKIYCCIQPQNIQLLVRIVFHQFFLKNRLKLISHKGGGILFRDFFVKLILRKNICIFLHVEILYISPRFYFKYLLERTLKNSGSLFTKILVIFIVIFAIFLKTNMYYILNFSFKLFSRAILFKKFYSKLPLA